jgi:hypothetical protein
MRTHTPTTRRAPVAWMAAAGLVASSLAGCGAAPEGGPVAEVAPLPATLAETGLFAAGEPERVAADVLTFTPQYPLWTDGAAKRRWIRLPPGGVIDATRMDEWVFPVGTKLWKEFAFGGRRVETRLIERTTDGAWRFAAYVWSADGRKAELAPQGGVKRAHEIGPGVFHAVPGRQDCLACHGARATPVLGFSALQLSEDRDPLAPHAEAPAPGSVDLAWLRANGRLRTKGDALRSPPRIAARSPRERAALGYLHANCGSCHATGGPLKDLGLTLDASLEGEAGALASALHVPGRFRWPGRAETTLLRLHPGRPEASLVLQRAASRNPAAQMPPLGTQLPDAEALALLEAWIREDLAPPGQPPQPPEE